MSVLMKYSAWHLCRTVVEILHSLVLEELLFCFSIKIICKVIIIFMYHPITNVKQMKEYMNMLTMHV